MKFRIVLFLAILFLTVSGTQAQPECWENFSPYNVCILPQIRTNYIIYGEIVSSEKVREGTFINRGGISRKVVVKVKKTFNDDLPAQIEIYLSGKTICNELELESRYIFIVSKENLDNRLIYFSERISRPVTDYSPQALNEVFSHIESVIKNRKENILEGVVLESLAKSRKVSLKSEEADRYVYDLGSYKQLPDVTIEAISEQNKRVYRTKSKSDGTYKIENIPPGKYKLRAYLPDGEIGDTSDIAINGSPCTRRQYIIVQKAAGKATVMKIHDILRVKNSFSDIESFFDPIPLSL